MSFVLVLYLWANDLRAAPIVISGIPSADLCHKIADSLIISHKRAKSYLDKQVECIDLRTGEFK